MKIYVKWKNGFKHFKKGTVEERLKKARSLRDKIFSTLDRNVSIVVSSVPDVKGSDV